jgi:hypothetical protein
MDTGLLEIFGVSAKAHLWRCSIAPGGPEQWSPYQLGRCRYLPKKASGKQHRTTAPTRNVRPMKFQPCEPKPITPNPYSSVTSAITRKKGPVMKQCTRPHRAALATHAASITARATVQIRVRFPVPTFASALAIIAVAGNQKRTKADRGRERRSRERVSLVLHFMRLTVRFLFPCYNLRGAGC